MLIHQIHHVRKAYGRLEVVLGGKGGDVGQKSTTSGSFVRYDLDVPKWIFGLASGQANVQLENSKHMMIGRKQGKRMF